MILWLKMTPPKLQRKQQQLQESLKIPAFLDCTINANAKTVVYDNLNLKNVKGTLLIKDQQAILKYDSNIFDGILAITETYLHKQIHQRLI